MEIGMIGIWSGAVVDIPNNYQLCDGTNGTPDLRDRFVVCSGPTYPKDDSGGSAVHNHDFTGDGHAHTTAAGSDFDEGTGTTLDIQSTAVTGTVDVHIGLPPYFSLAYIQRMA